MSQDEFLSISEEDIQRIAQTGPQSTHDDEVVSVVFRHLSHAPNTVGALSSYASQYVLTVSQLFNLVKHAPAYLESSIKVGGFQVDRFDPEQYMLYNQFRMVDFVRSLGDPEIAAKGFVIPLNITETFLYNEQITLTVEKKYIEGYADKLNSLYGFQCVASKGTTVATGTGTLTLRKLILALQNAAAQNPNMPVIIEWSGSEFPIVGVCWVEEDDTVLLHFVRDNQ